ncbi:MAG: sigE 36, partial [Gemmataceae bacterium]|nr:sigE 36 [Gemmataceae bacterium]
GLVAGAGGPSAAVPPELARRAVAGVFEFLAGGGAISTPAAAVAKGVVGSMAKLKVSALMAATTVVLVVIGIVGAGDPPGTTPPPAVSAAPLPAGPAAPPRPAEAGAGVRDLAATYRAANFVVHAPTPVIARVVAAEAEFQRREIAKRWLGRDRSAWESPCEVRVTIEPGAGSGNTTFRFRPDRLGDPPTALVGARTELRGPLETILLSHLPREVTRMILATHLPGPVPPWADAGVSLTAEPDDSQMTLDAQCRKLPADRRGLRLMALLRMTGPAPDAGLIDCQAHSVVRYLLTRQPNADVGEIIWSKGGRLRGVMPRGGPAGNGILGFDPENRYESLLAFVWVGMTENTPESWDRAAKEVYGVESVDWLERGWKSWLDNPKSAWNPQPEPPAVVTPPAPAGVPVTPPRRPGELVPPTPLPGVPSRGSGQPAPSTPGATHRTANFLIHAPTADVARSVGAEAERRRKELARIWLGKELPDWSAPCPITVNLTLGGSGGATTFEFLPVASARQPGLATATMELHGPLRQVLTSVLPHEVLHTILATHFGKPLPRWADEGIALTAASEEEQAAHDARVRQLLDAGRGIRLKHLFPMGEYPRDMIVSFAQGHSVVRFLLAYSRRNGLPPIPGDIQVFITVGPKDYNQRLLAFLAVGMTGNTPASWNKAAKMVYGFESVEKLEEAWLDWLRKDESKLKGEPGPVPSAPKDDRPELIPPTKLPGAVPKP